MDIRPPYATESFGELLRFLRKRVHLTQSELASLVGYSDAQINRLERNVRAPDPSTVAARFVSALGLESDSDQAARLIDLARKAGHKPAQSANGNGNGRAVTHADAFVPSSTKLPSPATELLGRDSDIAAALAMLGRDNVRMLTLVGPPGVGKTRLAIRLGTELEGQHRDGTGFVPLAAVVDGGLIADAILQVLGVTSNTQDPLTQVKNVLRKQDIVLVLDNFEHLLEASKVETATGVVAELVASAPNIKLLVTSRAPLRLSGEYLYEVPSLTPAVARDLFVQRAAAASPAFNPQLHDEQAIADICRRLDYLPLAIELAAARIRLFEPSALLKRLAEPLALLTVGLKDLPPRQRTLRNAIDWSYALLAPEEQILFRRLSVFADGCTMPMIEAIAGDDLTSPVVDLTQSLVDKSLLQTSHRNHTIRFGYLETLRVYAAERLAESAEADHLAEQAAQWFVDQVESAQRDLRICESLGWFEWVDAEINNLRDVIVWSMRTGKVAYGMRLAAHLGYPWRFHGPLRDSAQLIKDLLAHPNARRHIRLYGQVLLVGASLAYGGGDIAQAERYSLEAQRIFESLGEQQLKGLALVELATSANMRGDAATALELISTSCALAESTGNKRGQANALALKGAFTREPKAALRHFEEAATLASEIHSAMVAFFACWLQSYSLLHLDELDAAKASLKQALEVGLALGMTGSTYSVHGGLCQIAIYQDDFETALAHGKYAVEGSTRHGSPYMRGLNLMSLGLAEHLYGSPETGEAMVRESVEIHRKYGRLAYIPDCLSRLACIAADTGRYVRAMRLFATAESLRAHQANELPPAERRLIAPRMAVTMANLTAANLRLAGSRVRRWMLIQPRLTRCLQIENKVKALQVCTFEGLHLRSALYSSLNTYPTLRTV